MIFLGPLRSRAAAKRIPKTQKRIFGDFFEVCSAKLTFRKIPRIYPRFQMFKDTLLNRSQATVHMPPISRSEVP